MQTVCDITRAVRAWTQLGHGAQVFPFGGDESIESHSKKTLVEGGHG
jgi:hypothetical protein